MTASASVPRPGDEIAGRYRIDEQVGQGSFGAVFRATQLPLGRLVAVKVLLPHVLQHAEGVIRFRREAELAQRLQHPNTVRMYDFGTTEAGAPFIVWELLTGRSVDVALASSGAFSVDRVARVGSQVLKSLVEAHAAGIIHRDIKPSNLFLCDVVGETDFVKVLDFGIARVEGSMLTQAATMLGTPAYMSPEQVSGAPVTPASDLYALGLTLAEMLAGQPVFCGDSMLSLAMAQLSDAPPPISSEALASAIGPVIARATRKDASARYASAKEMLAALDAASASIASRTLESPRGADVNAPTEAIQVSTEPHAVRADAASVDAAGSVVVVVDGGRASAASSAAAGPSPRAASMIEPWPASVAPSPPTPARVSAPPRRARYAIATAACVVLGGVATAVVLTQRAPPPDGTPLAGSPTAAAPLTTLALPPAAAGSLRSVGAVRAKLKALGYDVTVVPELPLQHGHVQTYNVEHGAARGWVKVWVFDGEAAAAYRENFARSHDRVTAIARDANVVATTNLPNGKEILADIAR